MIRSAFLAVLARLWRESAGAALVEFTLVLPLLVTLGLGMFEFGRALYQYQQVVNGVRDATRYLAHQSNPSDATLQSQARTLATKGCLTSCGSVHLRVPNWHPTSTEISFSVTNVTIGTCSGKPCYRGNSPLHEVVGTATVNYQPIGLLSALGFPSLQFHVRHEERNIPD